MFEHTFLSQLQWFIQLGKRIKNNYRAQMFNPFKPEFTIVIFIHYKTRVADEILDLQWMKMIWSLVKN